MQKAKILISGIDNENEMQRIEKSLEYLTTKGEMGIKLSRNKDVDTAVTINAVEGFNATDLLLVSADPTYKKPEKVEDENLDIEVDEVKESEIFVFCSGQLQQRCRGASIYKGCAQAAGEEVYVKKYCRDNFDINSLPIQVVRTTWAGDDCGYARREFYCAK